ncbi:MAG: hypothetical protein ACUVTU_09705 [Desulfurispora sp.]|uniref:hypothetical protein n=1 Tax=Desulfurispora sp. TaxID=3014275 RepID=UPI00404A956E
MIPQNKKISTGLCTGWGYLQNIGRFDKKDYNLFVGALAGLHGPVYLLPGFFAGSCPGKAKKKYPGG